MVLRPSFLSGRDKPPLRRYINRQSDIENPKCVLYLFFQCQQKIENLAVEVMMYSYFFSLSFFKICKSKQNTLQCSKSFF